jgi:hypothetical protein
MGRNIYIIVICLIKTMGRFEVNFTEGDIELLCLSFKSFDSFYGTCYMALVVYEYYDV